MRLSDFLKDNRAELISRCRAKVSARRAPAPTSAELERGVPLFLDELIRTFSLRLLENPDAAGAATEHGGELMNHGFTVAQVVHDYGDVCQAVTELAIELKAPISAADFRIFNRCLDDAMAVAVTEFARTRDLKSAKEMHERLGILAHEQRNLLSTARLTFDILVSGRVGLTGSTAAVLERSLTRLSALIDQSLAEVRIEAGVFQRQRIEMRRFLEEVEVVASLGAKAKGIMVSVAVPDDGELAIEGDPQILAAILVNLVQNAIKFTRPQGHVVLGVRATNDRIAVDVADECGGLPPGAIESMFRPFEQHGEDRSGLGLGLIIARRGAEAHGGEIRARDVPGTGCVFTLDLPRAQASS